MFQLTAARRRLARFFLLYDFGIGFNSQPPEGGWLPRFNCATSKTCFNSQPPEGGWLPVAHKLNQGHLFQLTAARRRLAQPSENPKAPESFNSQPPEGGWETATARPAKCRCFNSQPPEGGWNSTADIS